MDKLNQSLKQRGFNEPLHGQDSEFQTYGCRHTNPAICKKNGLTDVCAFEREDGICKSPSKSWAKQYHKLKLNNPSTSK
jgi:hypothetical protein